MHTNHGTKSHATRDLHQNEHKLGNMFEVCWLVFAAFGYYYYLDTLSGNPGSRALLKSLYFYPGTSAASCSSAGACAQFKNLVESLKFRSQPDQTPTSTQRLDSRISCSAFVPAAQN